MLCPASFSSLAPGKIFFLLLPTRPLRSSSLSAHTNCIVRMQKVPVEGSPPSFPLSGNFEGGINAFSIFVVVVSLF